MTGACHASAAPAANRDGEGGAAAPRPAERLGLAAAPTFAIMALATQALGGGPMDALCTAEHGFALGGMVPMYALMSAFHLAPWLNLASRRRSAAIPSPLAGPRQTQERLSGGGATQSRQMRGWFRMKRQARRRRILLQRPLIRHR